MPWAVDNSHSVPVRSGIAFLPVRKPRCGSDQVKASAQPVSSYSIRYLLFAFALAVATPLLGLLSYLLYESAVSERSRIETRLQQVALNLSENLQRDFDRRISLLETLATSPLVTAQDWQSFYQQARAALQNRAYLVLTDDKGRQLVNTYVPFGSEPPITGDPETVRRIEASKQPVVSNLFVSLVVKRPVFNISIPVLRDGQLRYVMSLGLLPEDVLEVLAEQRLDPQWVASVWDRNGVIIARTRSHSEYVGKTIPAELQAAQLPDDVLSTVTLDGEDVVRAIAILRNAEWRVSVNVPITLAQYSLGRTMWVLTAVSAFSLLLAGLLAYLGGRTISAPIVQAAAAAKAFGAGEDVKHVKTWVAETNEFVSVLSDAAQRQRILSQELIHRCKNILSVVQLIVERSFKSASAQSDVRADIASRLQALARAHELILKDEWHGTDLREIAKAELGPFGNAVEIDGPSFVVAPELNQPLMLAFHELATNAAKYGALSTSQGRVHLHWTVTCAGGNLSIVWQERGGPSVGMPARKGFGSTLLEKGIPNSVATLEFDPAGFCYRLEIALPEKTATAERNLEQSARINKNQLSPTSA